MKRYQEAVREITTLVEITPDYAYARFIRAEVYEERGDESKALEEYRKALDLAPDKYILATI